MAPPDGIWMLAGPVYPPMPAAAMIREQGLATINGPLVRQDPKCFACYASKPAAQELAMSLLSEGVRAQLMEIYDQPGRHYHGLRHIEALLALAKEHAREIGDGEAVEAAIWFHDAVYDTRKADNEAQSAELAAKLLDGAVAKERSAVITAMIRATADHSVPPSMQAPTADDCALFLDMDLAILAGTPEQFSAYERAVRLEYGWVSEADWIAGRSRVLRNFLGRPFIYASPQFRGTHEAAARSNLAASLASLEGGPAGRR